MSASLFLDKIVPLKGASHAEVVAYAIDVPMRYAECYATLANGRKARFVNAAQFIGWSDEDGKRAYLFRKGRRRIEIRTQLEESPAQTKAGLVRQVISWPSLMIGGNDLSFIKHDNPSAGRLKRMRKVTMRDGSLMVVRRWRRVLARCVGYCGTTHAVAANAPDGLLGGAPV
ncbi:MAG: hypothetical protein OEM60_00835 [Gammaproteobacteria bacterium]|nr:hypothetical protein [Gammaproteobacteria bacterium]MDH3429620.1 hypothetical protein [Gammaproteobacteria bacterium]MDH3432376.1 hypothetical protein [Gammaproteobacteria bacterium]